MAYQDISTGYKPEFALGALYQGYNAGNADNASQLANLANEQALQKARITDPYDALKSVYEGQLANAKSQDPNYIPWQLKGQMGQMMSQDAAGRMKQDTYQEELDATKQELTNKLKKGKLTQEEQDHYLGRINDLKRRRDSGELGQTGTSGFTMQQPEQQSDLNPNYGNEGRGLTPLPILKNEAAMKTSMGDDYRSGSKPYDLETIDKEIKQFGDKTGELSKERARIVAELSQGGTVEQPTSIMQRFSQSGTDGKNKFLQGIPGTDTYHEGMMGILMDTPEFRQKLALGEQKTDSAEEIAAKRLEAAAAKAKKELSDPKYNEQLATAFKMYANPSASPQQKYEAETFIYMDRQRRLAANPTAYTPKMDLGQYGIPMQVSPVNQPQAPTPPSGDNTIESKVKASGQTYEPSKYDYRIGPNGEVQRKQKG